MKIVKKRKRKRMNNYFMGQDGFNWFVGVVEDRADPEKAGRVRVRCLGYHSAKTEDIPMEDLPWASVMMPVTAGANSGIGTSSHFLLEGTWVVGFFRDPAKQEPVIMGALPGMNTTKPSDKTIASSSEVGGYSLGGGFKDPKGVYPTELYLNNPDTNLLAQNDPAATGEEEGETDFSKKTQSHPSYVIKGGSEINDEVHTKWKNASEADVQQVPSTQEKSAYPYNHVFETETGHYVEFDDTEGNERIHLYHKMGTFIEIDSTGNMIIKTVGNVTNITAGNMDTYVKGNYSVSVGGNIDIYATGNLTEKVDGNRLTTITGTETLEITGAVTNTFKDKLTEEVTMAVEQTYSASLKTTITAAANLEATGVMTIKGSVVSFN
jgi:hypothetical protein